MATRSHPSAETTTDPTPTPDPAENGGAADRALGRDVHVVTRRTVVDGTVRREIGFERRPSR